MISEAKENGCNEQEKYNELGLNFTCHLVPRSLSFIMLMYFQMSSLVATNGIYHFFISLLLYTLGNKSPNKWVILHFSKASGLLFSFFFSEEYVVYFILY